MANALSTSDPAPAVPQPNVLQMAKAEEATPAATAPGGNQLAQGQQQQQQPAPTHEEAVAALRHFDAISHELEVLLTDPALGRKDMKGDIIDAMTRLVAGRIIGPSEAVPTLGSVPKEPLQQRKWLQQHFSQAMMAENAVLEHHRQAFPGTGNWQADQMLHPPGNADRHMDTMKGVRGHYGRG